MRIRQAHSASFPMQIQAWVYFLVSLGFQRDSWARLRGILQFPAAELTCTTCFTWVSFDSHHQVCNATLRAEAVSRRSNTTRVVPSLGHFSLIEHEW